MSLGASENPAGNSGWGEQEQLSFLDLAIALAKHKFAVLGLPVLAGVLSASATLLLPDIYTAKAVVMPPQQPSSATAALVGQLGQLTGSAAFGLGLKTPGDLYVGMLGSRSVADRIIKRFNLQQIYEAQSAVDAREALADRAAIELGKDGLLVIAFDDEDPVRAAEIANAFVEELDHLTKRIAVTEAGQRRLFFAEQLKQTGEQLANAELAFKRTQEKTGIFKLEDQGRVVIDAVATTRAQIAAKEVELNAMRGAYATEQNPEYVRAQQQLQGLKAQLTKLERAQDGTRGSVFVPTGRIPEAGLEYIRSIRDVRYYETVYELLSKQLELAKIDEAKEAALVQVVDKAVPPDRRSKPRRAAIVVVITLLAVCFGILWACMREIFERKPAAERAKLDVLLQHLKR